MPRQTFTHTMYPLKRLRVNIFDYKSVKQLAKELPEQAMHALRNEKGEVIQRAMERTRDMLMEMIHSDAHSGTGNLADSLTYHYNQQYMSAYLYFDTAIAPYAQYVEFGTGVVGAASPAPSRPAGWEYDENDHGTDGWMYVDDTGKLKHTRGQVGMNYIWFAEQELEKILPKGVEYQVVRGRP